MHTEPPSAIGLYEKASIINTTKGGQMTNILVDRRNNTGHGDNRVLTLFGAGCQS